MILIKSTESADKALTTMLEYPNDIEIWYTPNKEMKILSTRILAGYSGRFVGIYYTDVSSDTISEIMNELGLPYYFKVSFNLNIHMPIIAASYLSIVGVNSLNEIKIFEECFKDNIIK